MSRRVLITGGAGFVGANLAVSLAERHPDWEVVAFDNLKRRGAELNLARLREAGVSFEHGDVRVRDDVLAIGEVDAIVECSAEPSVLAGIGGSPDYLIQTNLIGAYHCLELARREQAQFVFLSTSRVYPVATLERAAYEEGETRFELTAEQPVPGLSEHGVSEALPLDGARTLYGTTKLSAELLIAEYAETYGVRAVIDRCGVIAGPWQMGKVDQGVFTYWLLAHRFGSDLRYFGYGGEGKQVRDLMHVDDLIELIDEQLGDPGALGGADAERGRRARGQPVAARDHRAVPRADRPQRGGRERGRRPARRPADLPVGLPRAVGAHRPGARGATRGRSSLTRSSGSSPTSRRSRRR